MKQLEGQEHWVNMTHVYLIITVNVPLTDDTVDEQGITTKGTKTIAQEALLSFGEQSGLNQFVTQVRHSLDWQKYLVEVTHEDTPTKADFTGPLSEFLGIDEQVISSAIDFEILGDDAAARNYLIAHKEEWEEDL